MRGHFNRPIVDGFGNLVPGCSVRLIQPVDGTTSITADIFVNDTDISTLTNPFITVDGQIDFYLAVPQRIRLGITRPEPGSTEYFIDGADVLAPV